MNIIKKLYCRTYQTIFKIALPFLPYRNPKILTSVKELPEILFKHRCSKPLIITDKSIYELKLTSRMENTFIQNSISYVVYDKTVPNPTTQNVEEAFEIYRQNHCDCIIGFGGGSSIDCAKVVGARVAKPHQSIKKMKGILKIHKRLPLLIAVPTTAGTGSETTLTAVITDSHTRHKYAINDFPLIPRYALLDPKITLSLPAFFTATTGLDALTHAVEAFVGKSTTPDTRRNALRAVKLIFENLDLVYYDGNNVEARKNMLKASFYAGCAFTKSYVGYVHAIAHSLGGEYNIPHGYANAVLLPYVLKAYGKNVHKKLRRLAMEAGLVTPDTSAKEAAEIFIAAIENMKKTYQIEDYIPQIQEEDLPKLSAYADKEANPLYPVPVLMDAKKLKTFYRLLMKKPMA